MAGVALKLAAAGRQAGKLCGQAGWLRATPRLGETSHSRGRLCHSGFTLVEALLAASLLTCVVSAVVIPFSAAARCQQMAARQAVALELAQDLMEEILSRPFFDPNGYTTPGPDAGESFANRAGLDNVDDYSGLSEAAGSIHPNLQTKAADPLAAQLARSAQVDYIRLTGQDPNQPMNVCRVIVHVSAGGNDLATLTRMVYGNVTN